MKSFNEKCEAYRQREKEWDSLAAFQSKFGREPDVASTDPEERRIAAIAVRVARARAFVKARKGQP